jgi:hypothetical protein
MANRVEPVAEAYLAHIFSSIVRMMLAQSRAVSVFIALVTSPAVLPADVYGRAGLAAMLLVAISFLLEGVLVVDALRARQHCDNPGAPAPALAAVPDEAARAAADPVTWHNAADVRQPAVAKAPSSASALIFIPPTTIDGVHVPGAYVTHEALRARLARESLSTPITDALRACSARLRPSCSWKSTATTPGQVPTQLLARCIYYVAVACSAASGLASTCMQRFCGAVHYSDTLAVAFGLAAPFASSAALRIGSLTATAPLAALLAIPAVALVHESSAYDAAVKCGDEPTRAAREPPRVVAALVRLALWSLVAPALIKNALVFSPASVTVWAPTLAAAARAGGAYNASAWQMSKNNASWTAAPAAFALTPTRGLWPQTQADAELALFQAWPAASSWVPAASLLVGQTTGVLVAIALVPALIAPAAAAALLHALQGDGVSFSALVGSIARLLRPLSCLGLRRAAPAAASWQRSAAASPTTAVSTTVATAVAVAPGVSNGASSLFRLPRSVRSCIRWTAHVLSAVALAIALSKPAGEPQDWLTAPVTFASDAPRIVADFAAAASGKLSASVSISSIPAAAELLASLRSASDASPTVSASIISGAAAAAVCAVFFVAAAAGAVDALLAFAQGRRAAHPVGPAHLSSSIAKAFRETACHFPAGLAFALALTLQPASTKGVAITAPHLTASVAAAFAFATLFSTAALILFDASIITAALFKAAVRDASAAGFDVVAVARVVAGSSESAPAVSSAASVEASSGAIQMPAEPPQLTTAQLKRINVIAAGLAHLRLRCACHGMAVALSFETYGEARTRVSGSVGVVALASAYSAGSGSAPQVVVDAALRAAMVPAESASDDGSAAAASSHIRGTDAFAPSSSFRVVRQALSPVALKTALSTQRDVHNSAAAAALHHNSSHSRSPRRGGSRRKTPARLPRDAGVGTPENDAAASTVNDPDAPDGHSSSSRVPSSAPRPLLVAVADPSGRAPFLLVPWSQSGKSSMHVAALEAMDAPIAITERAEFEHSTAASSAFVSQHLPAAMDTGADATARSAATQLWAQSSIPLRDGNKVDATTPAGASLRSAASLAASPYFSPRNFTVPSSASSYSMPSRARTLPDAITTSRPTPFFRTTQAAKNALNARDPQTNTWPPRPENDQRNPLAQFSSRDVSSAPSRPESSLEQPRHAAPVEVDDFVG